MGAACCCLRDDWEDYANPNNSIYRNCICLHCFVQNFLYLNAWQHYCRRFSTHKISNQQNITIMAAKKLLNTNYSIQKVLYLNAWQHYCRRFSTHKISNQQNITIMAAKKLLDINYSIQKVLYLYASLFHRGEERALPSSAQGTASLSSSASVDNSLPDMFRPPPRPLPYDADPRYFRLQRDGLVSRREKGSSHAHEETEPLRSSEVEEESDSVSTKNKWNEFTCGEISKEYNSKASQKLLSAKPATGYAHVYTSSEDEDVCPTCLEEYTKENPKIVTQCSHHFHLGCIYEWMERSDNCPVCGKVMAFDETI